MQENEADFTHRSVLLDEVLGLLETAAGGTFVDATLGLGGHSEAMLESSHQANVIGIDQDVEALGRARKRLERFGERFRGVHSNFSSISDVVERNSVDGILADLGVSSMQLDDPARGFTFKRARTRLLARRLSRPMRAT